MFNMTKRYSLILDTYAHSARNTYYYADFDTIAEAREALLMLIIKGTVTMEYAGESPNKIYCAFIAKRRAPHYQLIKRTDNGIHWYTAENPDLHSAEGHEDINGIKSLITQ